MPTESQLHETAKNPSPGKTAMYASYEGCTLATLIANILGIITAIKTEYPKNAPNEKALKWLDSIQQALVQLESSLKKFDQGAKPEGLGKLLKKLKGLGEELTTYLSSDIMHPLQYTFLDQLLPLFYTVPNTLKETIPFLDPSSLSADIKVATIKHVGNEKQPYRLRIEIILNEPLEIDLESVYQTQRPSRGNPYNIVELISSLIQNILSKKVKYLNDVKNDPTKKPLIEKEKKKENALKKFQTLIEKRLEIDFLPLFIEENSLIQMKKEINESIDDNLHPACQLESLDKKSRIVLNLLELDRVLKKTKQRKKTIEYLAGFDIKFHTGSAESTIKKFSLYRNLGEDDDIKLLINDLQENNIFEKYVILQDENQSFRVGHINELLLKPLENIIVRLKDIIEKRDQHIVHATLTEKSESFIRRINQILRDANDSEMDRDNSSINQSILSAEALFQKKIDCYDAIFKKIEAFKTEKHSLEEKIYLISILRNEVNKQLTDCEDAKKELEGIKTERELYIYCYELTTETLQKENVCHAQIRLQKDTLEKNSLPLNQNIALNKNKIDSLSERLLFLTNTLDKLNHEINIQLQFEQSVKSGNLGALEEMITTKSAIVSKLTNDRKELFKSIEPLISKVFTLDLWPHFKNILRAELSNTREEYERVSMKLEENEKEHQNCTPLLSKESLKTVIQEKMDDLNHAIEKLIPEYIPEIFSEEKYDRKRDLADMRFDLNLLKDVKLMVAKENKIPYSKINDIGQRIEGEIEKSITFKIFCVQLLGIEEKEAITFLEKAKKHNSLFSVSNKTKIKEKSDFLKIIENKIIELEKFIEHDKLDTEIKQIKNLNKKINIEKEKSQKQLVNFGNAMTLLDLIDERKKITAPLDTASHKLAAVSAFNDFYQDYVILSKHLLENEKFPPAEVDKIKLIQIELARRYSNLYDKYCKDPEQLLILASLGEKLNAMHNHIAAIIDKPIIDELKSLHIEANNFRDQLKEGAQEIETRVNADKVHLSSEEALKAYQPGAAISNFEKFKGSLTDFQKTFDALMNNFSAAEARIDRLEIEVPPEIVNESAQKKQEISAAMTHTEKNLNVFYEQILDTLSEFLGLKDREIFKSIESLLPYNNPAKISTADYAIGFEKINKIRGLQTQQDFIVKETGHLLDRLGKLNGSEQPKKLEEINQLIQTGQKRIEGLKNIEDDITEINGHIDTLFGRRLRVLENSSKSLDKYLIDRNRRYIFKDFFFSRDKKDRTQFIDLLKKELKETYTEKGNEKTVLQLIKANKKRFPGKNLKPLLKQIKEHIIWSSLDLI